MKDISYGGCYRKITFKVLLTDFIEGVFRYRYPLCCVLQFIWENYIGIPPALARKEKYNLDINDGLDYFGYVPCDRCIEKYLKEIK